MDKKELGQSGILISRLGLGTVKFGRNQGVKYPNAFDLPSEESLAILLSEAKNLGINLLDTAPAYGLSEERLGRLLHGQRQDWVIVGKAGEEFENGASVYNFTPDHFEKSLHRSLKRLQTDYLDVLLVHSDGHDEAILSNHALIETLYDFKKRGLVRAVGASTKTVEGGLMALSLLDVAMVTYSITARMEEPVLERAARDHKGLLLKKILGSGYAPDPQTAISFALGHPGVTAGIIGTLNPEHLRKNVQAAQKALAA